MTQPGLSREKHRSKKGSKPNGSVIFKHQYFGGLQLWHVLRSFLEIIMKCQIISYKVMTNFNVIIVYRLLWTVTTIDLFTTILSGLLRSCTIQQWITLNGIRYYADLLDMIFTRRAASFWSNFVLLISPLCCAPEPHVTQHAHETMCSKRSVRERARKRSKWASSLPVYNLCSYFISP